MNFGRDPLFIGKLNASSYKKEPVQAFAPSTIRLEGDALCDAMRKLSMSTRKSTHRAFTGLVSSNTTGCHQHTSDRLTRRPTLSAPTRFGVSGEYYI